MPIFIWIYETMCVLIMSCRFDLSKRRPRILSLNTVTQIIIYLCFIINLCRGQTYIHIYIFIGIDFQLINSVINYSYFCGHP